MAEPYTEKRLEKDEMTKSTQYSHQQQAVLGGPFLWGDSRGEGEAMKVLCSPLMPEQKNHHVCTGETHDSCKESGPRYRQREKEFSDDGDHRGK